MSIWFNWRIDRSRICEKAVIRRQAREYCYREPSSLLQNYKCIACFTTKKSDAHNMFNNCQMRQLRNLLVRFSSTKTRFREHALTVHKSNDIKMAIRINHATLYLVFQNEYDLYKKDGSLITSYNSIKTTGQNSNFQQFFQIQYYW